MISLRALQVIPELIEKYGIQNQVKKCLEEIDELKYELENFADYNHDAQRIAEEIADVFFTLDQVILMLGIQDQVENHYDKVVNHCMKLVAKE